MVVLSSASSKTAYGTAFLLRGERLEVVGLTSTGNVAFTEGLGCYDRALSYEAVAQLSSRTPTLHADLAGSAVLTSALRAHLGQVLVHEVVDAQAVWADVYGGHSAPRLGHVVAV